MKRLLLCLACLVGAGLSYGQGIGVGVVGGLNYSSPRALQNGSARDIYERRSGYDVGLFLDLGLSSTTHLRPGFFWSVKRIGAQSSTGSISQGSDFEINFVNVPLDLVLQLAVPLISPYVLLGPQAAVKIDAKDAEGRPLRDRIKVLSWSGNVGLGLRVRLLGLALYPEIRYNLALDNLNEPGAWDDLRVNLVHLRLGLGL
ncbi:MAG: outer membrane beta-barrel protein [Bacteroidetes bacterium]|nr:outer membrane beta-barrel protein [Rhodothermia bacterium]MCS7155878.1 outer membrane beta-barrel protein [Bacteroidota bacterium]MCX7906021.1 outer membrane beta-barrel protein [Bacteroidota bacterium]MDW8138149.1 outer membrane beta-barrel protein [Bacteroidota bacterium]MDW8285833.1 outer membrane beta-barrel protein [Bacteroidota bacterium]